MKLFLAGILLLNISMSYSANKFIKGDGKFIATDDDTLALKSNCFKITNLVMRTTKKSSSDPI